MSSIHPRFQVPLGINQLPTTTQLQQLKLLQQLSARDPREGLSCQLKITRKILETLEHRLHEDPENDHQLYLQEVHRTREAYLIEALRLQNTDQRYHALEKWVNEKVKQLDPEGLSDVPELSAEAEAQRQKLLQEQKTWQHMVHKVKERLLKKPGDQQLIKLLSEHQGRLLRLQETLRQQSQGIKEEALVLSQFDAPEVDVAPTEKIRLQREIEMLEALCEKTRQRLQDKPELLHLKALIAQHEERLKALRAELLTA